MAAAGRLQDAKAHVCNVADQAEVDRVFGALLAAERVDILVNNAGIAGIGTVATTLETDFGSRLQCKCEERPTTARARS